jgi:hypothetical protein
MLVREIMIKGKKIPAGICREAYSSTPEGIPPNEKLYGEGKPTCLR